MNHVDGFPYKFAPQLSRVFLEMDQLTNPWKLEPPSLQEAPIFVGLTLQVERWLLDIPIMDKKISPYKIL